MIREALDAVLLVCVLLWDSLSQKRVTSVHFQGLTFKRIQVLPLFSHNFAPNLLCFLGEKCELLGCGQRSRFQNSSGNSQEAVGAPLERFFCCVKRARQLSIKFNQK